MSIFNSYVSLPEFHSPYIFNTRKQCFFFSLGWHHIFGTIHRCYQFFDGPHWCQLFRTWSYTWARETPFCVHLWCGKEWPYNNVGWTKVNLDLYNEPSKIDRRGQPESVFLFFVCVFYTCYGLVCSLRSRHCNFFPFYNIKKTIPLQSHY